MKFSFLRLDPRKAISHPSVVGRADTFVADTGWIITRDGDTVTISFAGVTVLVPWTSVLQASVVDEAVHERVTTPPPPPDEPVIVEVPKAAAVPNTKRRRR